jgi:hypothetical protein
MMHTTMQSASVSKGRLWTGRVLSVLPALLLFSSGINLMFFQSEAVRESFAKFGYPDGLIPVIGMLELACAVLYMIPRTALLGAIAVTAYLGGATATHVRVNDPGFLAPVVVGILIWVGLYLRENRLGGLIPLRGTIVSGAPKGV